MPFDVMQEDNGSPSSDYGITMSHTQSMPILDGSASIVSFASSNNSDSNYQGLDQIEFFYNVKSYLHRRIEQDTRGSQAQAVDQKYDEALSGQVVFIDQMLQENNNGNNVIKGKTANELEHCLKSLIPIVRVGDSKFLFGTSVKTVQINSEKLMVQVGGGVISIEKHWRAVAVSEIIKLNKLVSSSKQTVSKVVKGILEKNGALATTVSDFMVDSRVLDELFQQQKFILKAWSKKQSSEQIARNVSAKKKKTSNGAGPKSSASPYSNTGSDSKVGYGSSGSAQSPS